MFATRIGFVWSTAPVGFPHPGREGEKRRIRVGCGDCFADGNDLFECAVVGAEEVGLVAGEEFEAGLAEAGVHCFMPQCGMREEGSRSSRAVK